MTPSGWYSTVEAWLAISRPDLTLWLPSTFLACLAAQAMWSMASTISSCASPVRLAGLQVHQLRELGDATGDHAAPG